MKNIHVNASLPKARSELLQCLLAQHPDVYSSITSCVSGIMEQTYNTHSVNQAFRAIPYEQRERQLDGFVREGIRGFYEAETDSPVIIDKGRPWLQHMESLWRVYPDAKMLVALRNVDEIIDSLEKSYRTNPLHPDFRECPSKPEDRSEHWKNRPPLKSALEMLEYRRSLGKDSRIMYFDSDKLIKSPVETMNDVFTFLELDPFEVDPNNVTKQVDEIDGSFGPLGNHNVRSTIG